MSAVPDWLAELARLDDHALGCVLRNAPPRLRRRLFEEWAWQAHGGQSEPDRDGPNADWRVWLMMAGRGFGKTRAGAEWVSARARATPDGRIALVGANLDDVLKVMIEGESGLQAVARSGEEVRWRASRGLVEFSSGAVGYAFSGERPNKLRGPQHHFAWCDELAKWTHAEAAWNNLMLGLRLGPRPRAVITTTPQPIALLKRIIALDRTITTGGRTVDNVHVSDDYRDSMTAMYGGTRLGRQELDGRYVDQVEGALWSRDLIERSRSFDMPLRRGSAATQDERNSFFDRIVIGVDPPAGTRGTCGIVVAGLGQDGIAYVLADASIHGASPEGWAAAVARAAEQWRADRIVAEANQGGAMVETVLRMVEPDLPIKLRHARDSKGKRAEPVAALFETGKARLAGSFEALENQLVGLMPAGGYAAPGSPDRADAMVWALAELKLGRRAAPRVRRL